MMKMMGGSNAAHFSFGDRRERAFHKQFI